MVPQVVLILGDSDEPGTVSKQDSKAGRSNNLCFPWLLTLILAI